MCDQCVDPGALGAVAITCTHPRQDSAVVLMRLHPEVMGGKLDPNQKGRIPSWCHHVRGTGGAIQFHL